VVAKCGQSNILCSGIITSLDRDVSLLLKQPRFMLAFLEARSHSWLKENLILLSRTLALSPNFVSTADLTSTIFTFSSKMLIKMFNKKRPKVKLPGTPDSSLHMTSIQCHPFGDIASTASNVPTWTNKNNSARSTHSLCF
jgi:hypothetical protein